MVLLHTVSPKLKSLLWPNAKKEKLTWIFVLWRLIKLSEDFENGLSMYLLCEHLVEVQFKLTKMRLWCSFYLNSPSWRNVQELSKEESLTCTFSERVDVRWHYMIPSEQHLSLEKSLKFRLDYSISAIRNILISWSSDEVCCHQTSITS
jgi:hypothetical protein